VPPQPAGGPHLLTPLLANEVPSHKINTSKQKTNGLLYPFDFAIIAVLALKISVFVCQHHKRLPLFKIVRFPEKLKSFFNPLQNQFPEGIKIRSNLKLP
jgi:glutamate synthase domain-containing protein 1